MKQKTRHLRLVSDSIPVASERSRTFDYAQNDLQASGVITQRGFTIVELLFVLAIGGLILVMSFMAINTTQRSKRDSQRKADLADVNRSIASIVNEAHGILPADLSGVTMPQAPDGGTYPSPVNNSVTTPCSTANTIYYERINDRSYKIKICLEAGDYMENH